MDEALLKALRAGNYHPAEMNLAQARGYFDGGGLPDNVDTALDLAQGEVHDGTRTSTYLIVKITKE